jgi:toxin ParE2
VTVRFLEIAEIELDQAIHWYGAQAPGLGNAFLIEVLSAVDRVERFPEAWHPLSEGIRRCRLSRFPYGLTSTTTMSWSWRSRICIAGRIIGAID